MLQFAAHISWLIVGEAADDGVAFQRIILAGAAIAFVEDSVEGPVELVLYSPMGVGNGEQFARREPV